MPVCAICLESIEDGKKCELECKHEFCAPCIHEWLLVRPACPLCKHAAIPGYDDCVSKSKQKHGLVRCPARECGKKIKVRKFRAHYTAKHSPVTCDFCNETYPEHLSDRHIEEECPELLIRCPTVGCRELMTRGEVTCLLDSLEMGVPFVDIFTGDTYEHPVSFLYANHRCRYLEPCDACPLLFMSHEDMVAHCAAEHADIIDRALSRKRRRTSAALKINEARARRMRRVSGQHLLIRDGDDDDDNDDADDDYEQIEVV